MARRDLTKKDFDKIIRAVRAGGTNAGLAKKTGFSSETVRIIRLTRTWNEFNEFKKSRAAKMSKASALKKSSQPKASSTKTADNKLQKQLDQVPNKPVTPAYVQELLDSMQEQRLATDSLIAITEKQTAAIQKLDSSLVDRFFRLEALMLRIKRIWWSRR